MSDELQQEAVDIASAALEKYNIEKDIAAQIKKEFDKRHGPTWHVVVGKNFGSYVTHGASPMYDAFRRVHRLVNTRAKYLFRNQTLHLFLHRFSRHPYLEVIIIHPTTTDAMEVIAPRTVDSLRTHRTLCSITSLGRIVVVYPSSLTLLISFPNFRRNNTNCRYTV